MSEQTTYLYRIENPNIPLDTSRINGGVSYPDLVGQWFAPDPSKIRPLILKNSLKVPGTRLVVAEVPTRDVDQYHVSRHPVASDMDVEDDNYLIPRDGSIPTTELPLDEVVGDLGDKRDFATLQEMKSRINHRLGGLSLIDKEPAA